MTWVLIIIAAFIFFAIFPFIGDMIFLGLIIWLVYYISSSFVDSRVKKYNETDKD